MILEDASKLNDVLVEEEGVLKDAEKDMAVRKAEVHQPDYPIVFEREHTDPRLTSHG